MNTKVCIKCLTKKLAKQAVKASKKKETEMVRVFTLNAKF